MRMVTESACVETVTALSVTGAGPVVYGLFADAGLAEAARDSLANRGQTWLTKPTR